MPTIKLTIPRPHDAQRRIIREAKRFNVVDCGRRFGKTLLGMDRCADPAVLSYPVGWFSPTYKDMLDVWREVTTIFAPIVLRKSVEERRLEFVTGGLLEFWSLPDGDAGRGRRYKRVIIDEAAKAPVLQIAWEQAIRPTLTDFRGDAWFLSTPKGRNYFWRLWGFGQAGREGWASWQMPTSENPFIAPEEIEAARADLPEDVFRQEYLAEFVENEGAVFRNVYGCLDAPDTTPEEHEGHELVAGVDWGKQADFTAISVGCKTCRVEVARDRFNQIDYAFQRARLRALWEKWGIGLIMAELNAMGEPIVEQLQRDGLPVIGFQTTAQSKPPLIESLALAFERQECQWIDDPVWTLELESYERTVSPFTGRSSYSAPAGSHDDTVIARALDWYAMLQPPLQSYPDEGIYVYDERVNISPY